MILMQTFANLVSSVDGIIWSMALVILCLAVGLYLSIRMKFPQVRLIGEMVRLLVKGEKSDSGITPFQAFAATVGARVGMGNVAGVATAIFAGGPGAVFWMWLIAFIGASSAFTEATLGQAYKTTDASGQYIGGPAHYIQKAIHCRPFALAFAAAAVIGPGILMPGVQINSLVSVFDEAFHVNTVVVAAISCVVLAVVICGGIKRIAKFAELLAPVMCVIYVLMALGVLVVNITKVPAALALIISSAFGIRPLFAGIVGSAISLGVRRGIYSNEAGMGCGAIVSAAAESSHPAKQGLVQAFSVYVDTLIICTCTALTILLTGIYNVQDSAGNLLVNNAGDLEAGIRWTQHAFMSVYGNWIGKVLAVIIVLFVFTSMLGYFYQAEVNTNYLTHDSHTAKWVIRIIFVLASFSGCLINADVLWNLGDIGYGLMAWFNIIAIVILAPKAAEILRDYEKQKKAGKDPVFDPSKFGIADEKGVWDRYRNPEN